MREIKFRAWDKEYSRMLKWEKDIKGLTIGGIKTVMSFNEEDGWADTIASKEIELMQYTGLKDKNGVEIYEGDILGENPIGEVIFSKGEFLLAVGDKENYVEYNLNVIRRRNAIVGNVYENPELLEDK